MKIVLLFFVSLLFSIKSAPVVIPDSALQTVDTFIQLARFRSTVYNLAVEFKTNNYSLSSESKTIIKNTINSIDQILKKLNLTISLPAFSPNSSNCKNDLNSIFKEAKNFISICPGRKNAYSDQLKSIYILFKQALSDCFEPSFELNSGLPSFLLPIINFQSKALCLKKFYDILPYITTLKGLISAANNNTINQTVDLIQKSLPEIKALCTACEIDNYLNQPVIIEKRSKIENCLSSLTQSKPVFEDFYQDLKSLSLFEISEDIEGVNGALVQILQQCKEVV